MYSFTIFLCRPEDSHMLVSHVHNPNMLLHAIQPFACTMPYQGAFPSNQADETGFQTSLTPESKKMRNRGPVIENPKELAADFACTVTECSSNSMDWVARNGDESLFQTLKMILPEVSY